MPDNKKTFRENSESFFKSALAQVPFLEEQDVEVTYFLQGVGSIVAKIVTGGGNTYVMKTTESANHTNAEICTYKAATDAGIKVPKLFYDGLQDGLPFLLMEYFDMGTISDKLKVGEMTVDEVARIKADFFCDLKKIEGRGYNWPTRYEDGVLYGNFEDINTFVDTWFCQQGLVDVASERVPTIRWDELLKYHGDKVKEQNVNGTCKLGTFDFQTGHVFASNPPTLFDPCMKLEPEYFDLAQLIIPFPGRSETDIALNKVVFATYQERFGRIDQERLLTAVWLQTFRKATNQLLRPDETRMRNGMHALGIISDADLLRKHVAEYLG